MLDADHFVEAAIPQHVDISVDRADHFDRQPIRLDDCGPQRRIQVTPLRG
jgi:hypothetical protein